MIFHLNCKLSYSHLSIAVLGLCTFLLVKLFKAIRQRIKATKLPAPRSPSWLFGFSREIFLDDTSDCFGQWYDELKAPVYALPGPLGSQQVVLMDPKAIKYFNANDTYGFVSEKSHRMRIDRIIGRGILWNEGDIHRRQRKVLSPAFSPVAISNLPHVFYENVYKVKEHWEDLFLASNEAIINIQPWMSAITLDSIGIAGFAHDFGAIAGRRSSVKDAFAAFQNQAVTKLSIMVFTLAQQFPVLLKVPTKRSRLLGELHDSMHEISQELYEKTRKEGLSIADGGEEGGRDKGWAERTIIGSLLKSGKNEIAPDEALAQMKGLLLAGFETTAVTLTWALIELARSPDKQDRLRAELNALSGQDPTYEQIQNELPYLDAVFRETLRLRAVVPTISRVAVHDHTIPLSTSMRTRTGELVDKINVARGTTLIIPLRGINRSEAYWGEDAKRFKPERWLRDEKGNTEKCGTGETNIGLASEIQGFHRVMTFGDGPRMCLGKHFASIEFKTVLAVLIRHYVFELRDGPETKITTDFAMFQRPKVYGEPGAAMPMRVKRIE